MNNIVPVANVPVNTVPVPAPAPVRWRKTIADGRPAAIMPIVLGTYSLRFFGDEASAVAFVAKANARLAVEV